jgi:uncharacterized protein YqeY
MNVKDRITADLKEAMRARDQVRLDTLRSALSAFTYRRVEAGHDLADDEQIAVIGKLVKQRNDSIAEYGKAGRQELVDKETRERDILATYLPAQLGEDEIRTRVREAIGGLPAEGRTQGAAMKAAMSVLRGVADGKVVQRIVTEELAQP